MPFAYANPENLYKKFEELKKEDVVHLQEWISKQPHLPSTNETELIFVLHSCYYNLEKSKLTIENHYTSKTIAYEIFGKTNNEEFFKCFKDGMYIPLPKLTPDGYQVLYCRINCDPNEYNFCHHMKCIDGCVKTWFLEKEPAEGFVIILDMDKYLFGHLTKMPLIPLKKFMFYLQEGLPVRLKGIHFINLTSFLDTVVALIKPFTKTAIMNMFHFHKHNSDLYKYVPQEILPKDLGGNEDSLEQLHEANLKRLNDKTDFFEIDEAKCSDESKRLDKSKYIESFFGVEGSFKKLELD